MPKKSIIPVRLFALAKGQVPKHKVNWTIRRELETKEIIQARLNRHEPKSN